MKNPGKLKILRASRFTLILAISLFLGSASNAYCESDGGNSNNEGSHPSYRAIYPIVEVGADFGGDPLVQAKTLDGSSVSIDAGRGLLLEVGGGGTFAVTPDNEIQYQLSFGPKLNAILSSNQNFIFTRWPLEGLVFYRYTPWPVRFGGGFCYDLWGNVSGSGTILNTSTTLNNSLGWMAQLEYQTPSHTSIGIRYTNLSFANPMGGSPFSANSVGLVFSWAIGARH